MIEGLAVKLEHVPIGQLVAEHIIAMCNDPGIDRKKLQKGREFEFFSSPRHQRCGTDGRVIVRRVEMTPKSTC